MELRFDQGPIGPGTVFTAPRDIIRADAPDDVSRAFDQIEDARSTGAWVAGYASYELGYALEERLAPAMPAERQFPLLCFGVYDAPRLQAPPTGQAGVTRFVPRWSELRYAEAFARVHAAIGAGDIYQANLTFPIDLEYDGAASDLFASLRSVQSVRYGVQVVQEGLPDILSRSPELFFRTSPDGVIETRPMKGTQPRSPDPVEDARAISFLRSDAKNRAENLMIVDLLRNDISRVSIPGTVKVPELFHVESYATVHQMTSLVQAQLQPGAGLSDILRALFPCGSITGAPKIRAMQVLAELEPWPREVYCGTIGWAAPDGSSEFNVAIRTLAARDGRATLNVGGGVVWDSTGPSEYEEALWKARFATQLSLISA